VNFSLVIHMDNAAFQFEDDHELVRILRALATDIEDDGLPHQGTILDANGNQVGSYLLTEI